MTALTVAKALEIQRQIARGRVDDRLGEKWLLDQAGESLINALPAGWTWAAQEVVNADFVAGQDWVELPPHTALIRSVRYTPAISRPVFPTTIARIQEMQVVEAIDASNIYYAVQYRGDLLDQFGQPVPTLQIWPTPSESQVGAFQVYTGGGWRSLEGLDDADYINIPPFIVPLYVEYIRAHVLGMQQEENGGDVLARLERIATSRLLRDMQAKDGALVQQLGPGRGGYLEGYRGRNLDAFIDHNPNSPDSAVDVW